MDTLNKENKVFTPPKVEDEGGSQGKKSKAVLVTKAVVGTKEFTQTLQFDSKEVPALASAEMYDAIFKAAKTCGNTTKEDMKQIDKDIKKFWGKSYRPPEKRKTVKSKDKPSRPATSAPALGKKTDTKLSKNEKKIAFNDDISNLLQECDDLLNADLSVPFKCGAEKFAQSVVTNFTSSSSVASKCTGKKNKNTRAQAKVQVMEVSDSDTEEEITPASTSKISSSNVFRPAMQLSSDEEDETPSDYVKLVFFKISFRGTRYNMQVYENQTIQEVRELLAKKANVDSAEVAAIDMYLGDDLKLLDNKTVKDCGIKNLCNVDAYYVERSSEDLYKEKSSSALKFKLQTDDRRGRETIFVYTQKTFKMQTVRDEYAKQMGMDPTKLKLVFDGDVLSMDSTPEECDLEGGECIDVVIST